MINIRESQDALSASFGKLQDDYNRSQAAVAESYATLVAALTQIKDGSNPQRMAAIAQAALNRVSKEVDSTPDMAYAIHEDEVTQLLLAPHVTESDGHFIRSSE